MNQNLIIYPVFAQLFLVMAIYILLAVRRARAVKEKTADLKKATLDNHGWPKDVIKVSKNLSNQFEAPVLFYIVCLVLFVTDSVTSITLGMAWSFIGLRYFHAYIHTTSNHIPYRFFSFVISLLILLCLMIITLFSI